MTSTRCSTSQCVGGIHPEDLSRLRSEGAQPLFGSKFRDRSWDADAYAVAVLADFTRTNWLEAIKDSPPDDSPASLSSEIDQLVTLALEERTSRIDEIVAQDRNISRYYERLLMISESSHPASLRLIRSSLRIGEMLGMYYKRKYMRPRPQQLLPALMPPIASPMTPSYPGGHALMAAIVTGILIGVAPEEYRSSLTQLEKQVVANRERAGLNLRSDSAEGTSIGQQAVPLVQATPVASELIAAAKLELRSAENYR